MLWVDYLWYALLALLPLTWAAAFICLRGARRMRRGLASAVEAEPSDPLVDSGAVVRWLFRKDHSEAFRSRYGLALGLARTGVVLWCIGLPTVPALVFLVHAGEAAQR